MPSEQPFWGCFEGAEGSRVATANYLLLHQAEGFRAGMRRKALHWESELALGNSF